MPNRLSTKKASVTTLLAFVLALGSGCASADGALGDPQNAESTAQAAVVGTAVKWHPGHYYTIMNWMRNNPKELSAVYSELGGTPALRGLQVRFLWAELETAEGVYDFSTIDKMLAEVRGMGKRLVIQVQTKSFNPDWKLVPDYLKTSEYEGGAFPFKTFGETTPRGENIKLWNTSVRDRLTALVRRLGARYNSNPNFEGIGFIETAFGQPITAIPQAKIDLFYQNLLLVNKETRKAFPNTMSIQEVNYPQPIVKSFVSGLASAGAGLSHPDIFLDEPGLNGPNGLYAQYPLHSGTIPLAPSVMQSNYVSTTKDGTGREPSVAELLAFARYKLKANYIFWTRAPGYTDKVLGMLRWKNQTSDAAGGLDTTCPTAFSSCVD